MPGGDAWEREKRPDYIRQILCDDDTSEIRKRLDSLQEKYGLSISEILDVIQSDIDLKIPLSIFRSDLSALELVSVYLHDELGYNFKRSGELLNRSHKNVWNAYSNARKKNSSPLFVRYSRYDVPVGYLAGGKLSMLECFVFYLREKFSMSYAEIGRKLKRDQRTIWTVYNRALKKVGS